MAEDFDMEAIRKNEIELRKKFGKSARDLIRENHPEEIVEVCDVPSELNKLIGAKKEYNEKHSDVEDVIRRIAGDCFIYYPENYADNWIGDDCDSGVDIFSYRGDVVVRVSGKIEDEKVQDFCTRTNLKLVDIRFSGSLLSNSGDYTYVFGYEHKDECDDEYDYCGCC